MSLRIAIPEPSTDTEYNQRSLPSYLAALHSVGATVVLVPLHERPDRVAKLLTSTQGLLLPGSRFDVDPHQYGETPIPACGPADPARTVLDELLLGDAFHLSKPIFGICHGTQTINVWRNGALIQDLPSVLHTPIDHSPGRAITDAHPIRITQGSRLATIARSARDPTAPKANSPDAQSSLDAQSVNSSHHQAVGTLGNNLRITAVSPVDNVIEAIELDAPDHWVVAVQWHPERTYTTSALSRSLFAAFIQAVAAWQPHRVEESVSAT
jgi:putative glutamine amidotransferase